jgi:hypothetical protein
MLIKLVVRFDPDQYRVRESASGLAARFEDEDEKRFDAACCAINGEHRAANQER